MRVSKIFTLILVGTGALLFCKEPHQTSDIEDMTQEQAYHNQFIIGAEGESQQSSFDVNYEDLKLRFFPETTDTVSALTVAPVDIENGDQKVIVDQLSAEIGPGMSKASAVYELRVSQIDTEQESKLVNDQSETHFDILNLGAEDHKAYSLLILRAEGDDLGGVEQYVFKVTDDTPKVQKFAVGSETLYFQLVSFNKEAPKFAETAVISGPPAQEQLGKSSHEALPEPPLFNLYGTEMEEPSLPYGLREESSNSFGGIHLNINSELYKSSSQLGNYSLR